MPETEEFISRLAEYRRWTETTIGRLFVQFENAHSRAWTTDQRESSSTKAMLRDWKACDEARTALVAAIKELQLKAGED